MAEETLEHIISKLPSNGRISVQHATPDEMPLGETDTPTVPAPVFFLSLEADDKPFAATSTIDVPIRGVVQRLTIHSVEATVINEAMKLLRPKQPQARGRDGAYITDDRELARKFPEYAKALEDFNYNVGLAYILYGTEGLELTDHGIVVWAADGSVRDLLRAIAALKRMGLTNTQWIRWYTAIAQMGDVRQEETEDFLTPADAN